MSPACPFFRRLATAALALFAAAAAPGAGAQAQRPTVPGEPGRVIVKFKENAGALQRAVLRRAMDMRPFEIDQLSNERAGYIGGQTGTRLVGGRMLGERTQVVMAEDGTDSSTLATRLAAHPDVAWAMVDRRRHFRRAPSDPLFAAGPASGRGPDVGQWYLRANTAAIRSAINAEAAWDLVRGSSSIVVAVLDSGVLSTHPDLASVTVQGYDMINVASVANDGNGRDADATDAGDWVTTADTGSSTFRGCDVTDSSWHGTAVAAIIAGAADNGVGIAGTAHGVRIQPVRVLGKCGGYDSDILAGMYFAGGVEQPGVPFNATPARVINMSLGSEGPCDIGYLEAVQALTQRNVLVVAAAGNSTGHATGTPANCPGVVGVAGLRHAGSKVGFSDLGPEITISAPGGNCVNIGAGQPCLYPIVTATNTGTRTPQANGNTWSDSFDISVGTSFAAPQVSAVAALMLSARPDLSNAQLITLLRRSARPFPTTGADNGPDDPSPVQMCRSPDGADQLQCYCTSALCGAGMLDALAAVQVTLNPAGAEEAARQLMNFAETAFPSFFPDRLPTQTLGAFRYRFNPATGVFLGVVVQPEAGWVLNGVYVMGGPFGGAPLYVGRVNDFITPVTSLAAPARATARR